MWDWDCFGSMHMDFCKPHSDKLDSIRNWIYPNFSTYRNDWPSVMDISEQTVRLWCGWNRMGLRILTPSPTLYITVGHHVLKPICNPEPTFVLSLISKDLEISHMNYWSSLTNVHFRFKIRSHLCHWWTQQIMGIVATTLPIFRNAPLPPLVQRRVSSPARWGGVFDPLCSLGQALPVASSLVAPPQCSLVVSWGWQPQE